MRVLIYDATETRMVGKSWALGAKLFKRHFNCICAASSWAEAASVVSCVPVVDELQYWGHGYPGAPILNDEPMTVEFVDALAAKVTPDSLVWFRVCSAFSGPRGIAFAQDMVEELGCRVASYTRDIGFYQSGLYSIRPGLGARWDPQDNGKSYPWPCRHTVTCLRVSMPARW